MGGCQSGEKRFPECNESKKMITCPGFYLDEDQNQNLIFSLKADMLPKSDTFQLRFYWFEMLMDIDNKNTITVYKTPKENIFVDKKTGKLMKLFESNDGSKKLKVYKNSPKIFNTEWNVSVFEINNDIVSFKKENYENNYFPDLKENTIKFKLTNKHIESFYIESMQNELEKDANNNNLYLTNFRKQFGFDKEYHQLRTQKNTFYFEMVKLEREKNELINEQTKLRTELNEKIETETESKFKEEEDQVNEDLKFIQKYFGNDISLDSNIKSAFYRDIQTNLRKTYKIDYYLKQNGYDYDKLENIQDYKDYVEKLNEIEKLKQKYKNSLTLQAYLNKIKPEIKKEIKEQLLTDDTQINLIFNQTNLIKNQNSQDEVNNENIKFFENFYKKTKKMPHTVFTLKDEKVYCNVFFMVIDDATCYVKKQNSEKEETNTEKQEKKTNTEKQEKKTNTPKP